MPPEPHVELPVGTVLGAFEITGFVASGGMGSVFKAKNRLTGQVRALKVMLPELAQEPEFLQRFIREIRITSSIEHPNVVRVFEPGIDGDRVFLPMELLEGETLQELMQRERLSPTAAVDIILHVGKGVALFHDQGVLHRDLKPSNIFMARQPDGSVVPKVLDFGAARPVVVVDEDATAAGVVIGSPHYMPVEQASGIRDLDARVDQYALGVILYQALTNTRPFEHDDTGHVFAKVLSGASFARPRDLVPELPSALEDVVLRAMSRERDDRYADLHEFLGALEGAMSDEPTVALLAMDDMEPMGGSTRIAAVGVPESAAPSVDPPETTRAPLPAPQPAARPATPAAAAPATPAAPAPVPSPVTGTTKVRATLPPATGSSLFSMFDTFVLLALSAAVAWRLYTNVTYKTPAPVAAASHEVTPPPVPSASAAPPPIAEPTPPPPEPELVPIPSALASAAPPAPTPPSDVPAPRKHAAAGAGGCVPRPGSPCM